MESATLNCYWERRDSKVLYERIREMHEFNY